MHEEIKDTTPAIPADVPAQDATPESQPQDGGKAVQTGAAKSWLDSLPPEAAKEIADLRAENAKWRKQVRNEEAARKVAEERQLAEQGKWRELADSLQARLNELQPMAEKAEEATKTIEELERAFTASLDERLNRIPDDQRKALVEPVRKAMKPADFAQWLSANEAKLLPPKPPALNAGERGVGKPPLPPLTPEQIAMAREAGMTHEQYAAQLAQIKEKRGHNG